ncbi:MAG: AAA family ATPase [Succinivibrionaceae bacterium]|nr:AAA family ATPase [Succinivibrionaceae bacterium]
MPLNLDHERLVEFTRQHHLAEARRTISVEQPGNPRDYDLWMVADPALFSGAPRPVPAGAGSEDSPAMMVRIYMPFQELLAMVSGVDPALIPLMPSKRVWATIKIYPAYQELLEGLVPELNPRFRPGFAHINTLIDVLTTKFPRGYGKAYYGYGEAGTGKTSTALWLLAALGYPTIQVNGHESLEIDDLFLRQIPDDGTWRTIDGPLLCAIRHSCVVIFDELDLAPPALAPALNDLIEGYPYAIPGYRNRTIDPQGGFRLLAFGNTSLSGIERGLYQGRNILDSSFRSRCLIERYEPLGEAGLEAILRGSFTAQEFPDESVKATARFVVQINKALRDKGILDTFSPRSALAFARAIVMNPRLNHPYAYALSVALPLAVEDEVLGDAAWDVLTVNFRHTVKKGPSFRELLAELAETAPAAGRQAVAKKKVA